MLFVAAAAALLPLPLPLPLQSARHTRVGAPRVLYQPRHTPVAMADEGAFCRGNDLLKIGQVSGKAVTARQVANVLGRWRTHEDWDTIGRARKMDDLSTGDYYEEDVREIVTDYSKGKDFYIARRPQRREFCQRHGLVQRWVLAENVGALPFTDESLAASVGATAAELDAEPLEPLAIDIVFDALTCSQSDMVGREQCDEKRASFVTPEGGLNQAAFGASLDAARLTIVGALAVFPGFFVLVGLVIAWQLDYWHLAQQWAASLGGAVGAGWAESGPALLLLPALILLVLTRGKAYGGLEEISIKNQDVLYLQRKARKKRTGEEGLDAVLLEDAAAEGRKKDGRPSLLYPANLYGKPKPR